MKNAGRELNPLSAGASDSSYEVVGYLSEGVLIVSLSCNLVLGQCKHDINWSFSMTPNG